MQKCAIGLGALLGAVSAASGDVGLEFLGRYSTGRFNSDGGNAEISAFDAASKRIFTISGSNSTIDIVNAANPAAPALLSTITLSGYAPNSIASFNGVIAIAAEDSANKQNTGKVFFYRASDGSLLGDVAAGALPDMLTFTPDGSRVVVANEGEPNDAYTNDPQGTVSIINVSYPSAGNITIGASASAGFGAFNATTLRAAGVRIYGANNPTAAQDIEPEYVAISADSSKAFVTLQENNAIATVDLVTGTVTDVKPLGFKNHGVIGLDASDRDQAVGSNNPAIKIKTVPGLFGMYQPDGIAAFSSAGQTYLITANEGDARAYTGLNEEARVSTLNLDATAFPNAATLKGNGPDSIGRLTVTNKLGDTDNDGDFDQLYVYGSRSFSIWKDDGTLVFDSGDSIEQMFKTGKLAYDGSLITFNANHSGSNNFDDRSDNKGPEPESVTLGVVDGVTYAFVGLERVGGVLMYDLTNPASPLLVDYLNSRDFDIAPTAGTLATVGDLGPEGLLFISAANSPTGLPLLVASNEVSGTVAVYSIPEPAGLSFLAASAMLVLRRRR